jgi:TonB-dependent starch-binding outer membrane protein SusC
MALAVLLISISGFGTSALAFGQDTDERYIASELHNSLRLITLDLEDVTFEEALSKIAEEASIGLSYDANLLPEKSVSMKIENALVMQAVNALLNGTGLQAAATPNGSTLMIEKAEAEIELFQDITGRVTDATTGEPLIGVTIMVVDTNVGTTTDSDGTFSLSIPDNAQTLRVSYIGYLAQEVPIGDQTQFDIELSADVAQLDDLVVVGYGVQRRSEITGSVGIVTADDLTPTSFNALQGLRGKVAGVNIFTNSGAPAGSNRVVIRGTGSLTASTDPLFVVDGVAMEDGINFLNPNDIESIEVLKDASATAIYGARGANGVVLVSTTRGGTGDRIDVGYDTNMSLGRMRGRMDVMNAEEFMEVQRIGLQNVPLFDSEIDQAPVVDFHSLDPELFDANGNPLYDTDWQREATRTAFSQDHNLRIQGGTDRSSLGAVLNYTNREGILLNSYMNRASLKVTYDVNTARLAAIRDQCNLQPNR